MAEAEYTVEGKELVRIINKCIGVIALGEKVESNSITLVFGKKGIVAEAFNSVAAYQTDIACEVVSPASIRMHILPKLLLSYAESYKSLTLNPTKQNLHVTSGKNFSADIFFIGENEEVVTDKPEKSDDIGNIAIAATELLGMVAGIRNRTDQQALGVMLEWSDGVLELTVGDTHHATVIDYNVKEKSSSKIVMTLPNLQRIMAVGKYYAVVDNRFIAWSDTEYLSIANQSESVFLADAARDAIKNGKRKTKFKVDTGKFNEMFNTLTKAVDETTTVSMKVSAGKLLMLVKTGASSAKAQMKIDDFKGADTNVSVTVSHARDCLSTIQDKAMQVSVFGNMLAFESKNKLIHCVSAMAAMGSGK